MSSVTPLGRPTVPEYEVGVNFPALEKWSTREVVTADKMNQQVHDAFQFAFNPAFMKAITRGSPQHVTGGRVSEVTWGWLVSPNDWGDRTENVTEFKAPLDGVYTVDLRISGLVAKQGNFWCYVRNDTKGLGVSGLGFQPQGAYSASTSIHTILPFEKGDIIRTQVYVSAGTDAELFNTSQANNGSWFNLEWRGAIPDGIKFKDMYGIQG
ncbi:hypothetical protein ACWCPS_20600 [Streptomyces mauvecolor]